MSSQVPFSLKSGSPGSVNTGRTHPLKPPEGGSGGKGHWEKTHCDYFDHFAKAPPVFLFPKQRKEKKTWKYIPQGKRKGTGQVMVWKFYYGWFTILQKRWVIIRASLIRVFSLSKILNKRKLPQNEARMGLDGVCCSPTFSIFQGTN